jgi:hypothetical protein
MRLHAMTPRPASYMTSYPDLLRRQLVPTWCVRFSTSSLSLLSWDQVPLLLLRRQPVTTPCVGVSTSNLSLLTIWDRVQLLLLDNHLLEMNSGWSNEASCHNAQDNFIYHITSSSLDNRLQHPVSDYQLLILVCLSEIKFNSFFSTTTSWKTMLHGPRRLHVVLTPRITSFTTSHLPP